MLLLPILSLLTNKLSNDRAFESCDSRRETIGCSGFSSSCCVVVVVIVACSLVRNESGTKLITRIVEAILRFSLQYFSARLVC